MSKQIANVNNVEEDALFKIAVLFTFLRLFVIVYMRVIITHFCVSIGNFGIFTICIRI